jgi:hypothetical protein
MATSRRDSNAWQAVLILLTSLAVIALLAWARGNPGDDGRFPDRDAVGSTIVIGG